MPISVIILLGNYYLFLKYHIIMTYVKTTRLRDFISSTLIFDMINRLISTKANIMNTLFLIKL